MAKRKSATSLKVFLNSLFLGMLGYKSRKLLTFQYAQEWLDRPSSFPISRSLPLREDAFDSDAAYAYFDNLLPDGVPVRQRIATRMHAASEHVFDLLEVVGRDCVGALQFIRDDDEQSFSLIPGGKKLRSKDIAERLRSLKTAPLAASEEEDFRISIAGAQEKTAFLKIKGSWYIPGDAIPTTHIFKPPIEVLKPGLSFSDSVENEWLCAQITKEFGLPVASCEMVQFEDMKVLVVERFDRQWNEGRLIRIPQEDMCQALGIPSFEKYQTDGGAGILQIMDLLNESQKRERDRELFMKAQVVFFLLAAIDGHAKNFSIRWGPHGFFMTPLYDILSAQPMVDRGAFQYQKIKMSMSLGDNAHWKVGGIFRRHFIQTAKRAKFELAEMEALIDETITQLPVVIKKVEAKLPKTFPEEIATSIFSGMESRLEHLKKISRRD